MIDDFQFDLLGITESWLTSDVPSHVYNVSGYTLHRCDRLPELGCSGGGVALYVRCEFKFTPVQLINVDSRIEYICGVVYLKGMKLCVCIAYRPPDAPYSCIGSLMHSLFIDMSPEVDSVVLLGDLNVNFLNKKRADVSYLENILQSLGLVQIIRDPTRVTDSSSSLIDVLIVDKNVNPDVGIVDTSNIFGHNGKRITDHKLVYCDVRCDKPRPKAKFVSYRNFKDFDCDRFIEIASSLCWDTIESLQDVDHIANTLTSNITQVFDMCAPVVRKRISRKKSPWRDSNLIGLTKIKNKCKLAYLSLKSQQTRDAYCKARNALNVAIRSAKKKYFAQNLNIKNTRNFWATLRAGGILNVREDNVHPFSPKELNDYFSTMGCGGSISKEMLSFFSRNRCAGVGSPFSFTFVSESRVRELINSISSTAFGIDGISIAMVRGLSPFCIGAITHLINVSLATGKFPSCWKQSVVIPLPKTNNPTSISQFRPISILPVLSKILEKVVCEQMVGYLESEELLPETQSGFRRGFSTCSALINVIDDMITAKDKGFQSLITALDFSQAFDSVNVDLLLAKLRFYHFDDNSVQWFSSYLLERTQQTKVDGRLSPVLPRPVGVPQGSCLGPILFLLYTADLKDQLNFCSLHSYADDSQLLFSYSPLERAEAVRKINLDLERVKLWSDAHGLFLNLDKCSVLQVNSASSGGQPDYNYIDQFVTLNGRALVMGSFLKILGVTLDSQLNFSNHVKSICQNVIIKLKTLYRCVKILPISAKLEIVRSTILPAIYYAIPAFAHCLTQENVIILTKLQNRALRFVYNLKKFEHISEVRLSSRMLSIMGCCDLQTVQLIYKVLLTGKPEYLKKKLIFRHQIKERSTRQDDQLHLPRVRLEIGKKAFRYFGPEKFNALPPALKSLSYRLFKSHAKEMFL